MADVGPTLVTLALVHAAATLVMTGVIWLVQLVQYPLFAAVGEEAFGAYHRGHMRRITWLVAPLMLIEVATGCLLVLLSAGDARLLATLGVALLAVVWGSTWLHQVPQHAALERDGFDARVHRRLVLGNCVRTAAWTARGGIALALVVML